MENTETLYNPTRSEETALEARYTQEQINNIVAKETGKTLEKALRELGFQGNGKAKDQLAQFKAELEEKLATVSQLETERLEQGEIIAQREKQLENQQIQVNLLLSGVDKNHLEEARDLVEVFISTGIELEQAVSQVVEKYPHLRKVKREIPEIITGTTGMKDGFSQIKEAFRKK